MVVVIDMDMPKSCGSCRTSGTDVCNEWTNLKGYDMGQKIADSCPIKCDIEDIKQEIEEKRTNILYCVQDFTPNDVLNIIDDISEIIDKHTKGDADAVSD